MTALLLSVALGANPETEVYRTQSGDMLFVCTSEPKLKILTIKRTEYETKTEMVSTCGMGCCLVPRTTRVPHVIGEDREIYVNAPTPLALADEALRAAGVTSTDLVYDLGCGDGRICALAARAYGARVVGLDIDPDAVKLSRANVRRNGVSDRVLIHQMDAGVCGYEATVVYAYSTPDELKRFEKQIRQSKTVRAAISYGKPWPTAKGRQVGDFWIWSPEPKEKAAQTADFQPNYQPSYRSTPTIRLRGRCFG